MRRKRSLWIAIAAVLLALPAAVTAQDIPDVVEYALADLSQQVGHQVRLNDIWQWRWVGDVYPDTSLGCPQPDEHYAPVVTNGFQFLLTYKGTTYDYRVSVDGTIVVLCETHAAGTAPQPEVSIAPAPVTPVDPAPVTPVDPLPEIGLTCPELLPPRLEIDEQARVNPNITRLNVRSQLGLTGPVIHQLAGGAVITVREGYECGPDDIAWWRVEFDGVAGWVAEGHRNVYYLEPVLAP